MSDMHPFRASGRALHPLEAGRTVCLQTTSSKDLPGTVKSISENTVFLELSRPPLACPVQVEEGVRITYWEDWIVYCWFAKVEQVSGPHNERLILAINGEGVTLQRRKSPRVAVSIPVSFVVTEAKKVWLIGKSSQNCQTQDLAVGGLRFLTNFPLEVADKLAIKLDLASSHQVSALGWVVRAGRVEQEGSYLNSVAVEFLQQDGEDQILLLQFLAQAAKQQT